MLLLVLLLCLFIGFLFLKGLIGISSEITDTSKPEPMPTGDLLKTINGEKTDSKRRQEADSLKGEICHLCKIRAMNGAKDALYWFRYTPDKETLQYLEEELKKEKLNYTLQMGTNGFVNCWEIIVKW